MLRPLGAAGAGTGEQHQVVALRSERMHSQRFFAIGLPQRVKYPMKLPVLDVVERDGQDSVRLEPAQRFLKALDGVDIVVEPHARPGREYGMAIQRAEHDPVLSEGLRIADERSGVADM